MSIEESTKQTNLAPKVFPIPEPKKRLDIPVSLVIGSKNNKIIGYSTLRKVLNNMVDLNNKKLIKLTKSILDARTDKAQYDKLKNEACEGFIIGEFKPTRQDKNCTTYVSLLGFDIDSLEDDFTTSLTLNSAKKIPEVFLAFPSPSGKGLRLFVWCEASPETHKTAYEAICSYLSQQLGISTDKAIRTQLKAKGRTETKEINERLKSIEHLDTGTKNISRLWFYTFQLQKDIYLNENSSVFIPPTLSTNKSEKRLLRPQYNVSRSNDISQLERVQVCLKMAKERNISAGRNNGLFALACLMVEHGVNESEILKYCLQLEESDFQEWEIKKTVNSAIKRADPNKFSDAQILAYLGKGKGKKNKRKTAPKNKKIDDDKFAQLLQVQQEELRDIDFIDWEDEETVEGLLNDRNLSTFLKIKSYLLSKYEFRKNVISNDVEYRLRDSEDRFKDLNEHDVVCEIKDYGIKSGIETDLMSILRSNLYVPKFNPIKYYFKHLPEWKESDPDYIDKLANFVIAKDQEWFNQQFKKMIVRSAACSLNFIPFNKQCFTLLGGQNAGKSTFFRFLCPTPLRNYYKDNIDITSKDGQLALCQNMFINFEEFDSLNKKELNKIKAMFTMDKIKVRPPYERRDRNFPRTCNFLASSNREEILTDETGNVRWLVFEITGIKHDKGGSKGYNQNIDIDLVWAQALALLKSGFQFNLTRQDLIKSESNNKSYLERTIEMEWIQKLYVPSSKEIIGSEFLMASEMLKTIQSESGNSRITVRNVGKALKFLGFTRSQIRKNGEKNPRYGYWITKIS